MEERYRLESVRVCSPERIYGHRTNLADSFIYLCFIRLYFFFISILNVVEKKSCLPFIKLRTIYIYWVMYILKLNKS